MTMKNILGLDLGTNSIGWAVVNGESDDNGNLSLKGIECAGSRIIPMDAEMLGNFNKGNKVSSTAERTRMRGVRRLFERRILRRERLHRVLSKMNFLPEHYSKALDRFGKFKDEYYEEKIAWRKGESGKYEFLFVDSFNEMLAEFREKHPEILDNGRKIPYDWTIYYLRKKALEYPVSKEELSWILLNFNQKRGYNQLRDELQESDSTKKTEYCELKVASVSDSGQKRGKAVIYDVLFENGWSYQKTSQSPLDWEGKVKEFIVTTEFNQDGSVKMDKEGNVKRSFRDPKEDDWTLVKEKTQATINKSGKTVGAYIYDALLENPDQKIIGKLVQTIERKFYRDELHKILEKQSEFHDELRDRNLYNECVEELYPHNDAHRNNIASRDFVYLLAEDILLYQRPLKSKKSLIDNCPLEAYDTTDPKTGEKVVRHIKCIARSHPYFQEFRLWQFIANLKIYRKGLSSDEDVTSELLPDEEAYADLFEWLNDRSAIKQSEFLKYTPFDLKKDAVNYRWNYVEDKPYPCNETRASILKYLKKAEIPSGFLTPERELELWHLLYSISVKDELVKALEKYAAKNGLETSFVESFQNIPPFEKEYGSFSAKAIRRMLPLMRMGRYWKQEKIDNVTMSRIEKILAGEYDEGISVRVREKFKNFRQISDFKGMPLWLVSYLVYGRHSESSENVKWKTPEDLDAYISSFKQYSLRNPIVEQVVLESLRTVRDIWKQVGHIDEIHIELGREMKNPADKRKQMLDKANENENTNLRIKALLTEFMNPEYEIENVRPYSPSQQEILRIYEDGVFSSSENEITDDIKEILKKFNEREPAKRPTSSEIMRYKLWLEQGYLSPYTGETIPLSKLFTPAYEIEHVIPQARYFDDSFTNKVICEAEVNRLKGNCDGVNCLGYEFIKKCGGRIVDLNYGKTVRILQPGEYEDFVKRHYSKNIAKMRRLLMEDIPDDFILRQLNDSRYISKLVKSLLSNIVREDGEQEATSKNVIVCTGGVTDRLKKDWGINDVWNRIILPRFERLNTLLDTSKFTSRTLNGHIVPNMPLEYQKGFNKKRIDHRHHAMDAIVIACAGRNLVNYLNNESASSDAKVSRKDLQVLLCDKVKYTDGSYTWMLRKPWESYTEDVYRVLSNIIVSFKQNLRVINAATNFYTAYDESGRKVLRKQKNLDVKNWAIRKSLHKDTVYGKVNLRFVKEVNLKEALSKTDRILNKEFRRKLVSLQKQGMSEKDIKKYFEDNREVWEDVNLSKIKVYVFSEETKDRYFATRKALDPSFDYKKIEEVTDLGIRKILKNHLDSKGGDKDLAFSQDGIDDMNRNIVALNGGKYHKPIFKVRLYEKADKYQVGERGNKHAKFVEAAKGTNLYFAVYETEKQDNKTGEILKVRTFATVSLREAIERQKQGLSPAPADGNGNEPLFVLSPNDLVYLPTEEERATGVINRPLDVRRVYKMVSSSGPQCFFINHHVATSIIDKTEFSPLNKMERAITGEMIKEFFVTLKLDRIGNIKNEI